MSIHVLSNHKCKSVWRLSLSSPSSGACPSRLSQLELYLAPAADMTLRAPEMSRRSPQVSGVHGPSDSNPCFHPNSFGSDVEPPTDSLRPPVLLTEAIPDLEPAVAHHLLPLPLLGACLTIMIEIVQHSELRIAFLVNWSTSSQVMPNGDALGHETPSIHPSLFTPLPGLFLPHTPSAPLRSVAPRHHLRRVAPRRLRPPQLLRAALLRRLQRCPVALGLRAPRAERRLGVGLRLVVQLGWKIWRRVPSLLFFVCLKDCRCHCN